MKLTNNKKIEAPPGHRTKILLNLRRLSFKLQQRDIKRRSYNCIL